MSSPDTSTSDTPIPDVEPMTAPLPRRQSGRFGLSTKVLVASVVVVAVLGVVVGRWVIGVFSPHLYTGTVLQADEPAPSMNGLSFADTGEPVDLGAESGDVVLVFFGYTNCPDVCPATMSTMTRALDELDPEQRERTEVWMVSVDPGRDDAQELQTYVEFFDPEFRGVTGTVEAIDQVSTQYGVFYQLEPTAAEGADDYLVDHTASVFGIGPDGALRVIWSPTVTPEQLGADLRELL